MKVSEILKNIYNIDWENLNILECGANSLGDETSDLENTNNCWYLEPNDMDYNNLIKVRKNTLKLALSDKTGVIEFIVSSQPGNSSCEYSEAHLNELKTYNSTFQNTVVDCITYQDLQKKLNTTFDILVLDVEGHEPRILKTFIGMPETLLPKIIVIECGYTWIERLDILQKLGYKIDCFYFNNCYLSKGDLNRNMENIDTYNRTWKKFVWNGTLIYETPLS
jgi:FkbM family methyltransferase